MTRIIWYELKIHLSLNKFGCVFKLNKNVNGENIDNIISELNYVSKNIKWKKYAIK